MSMLVFSINLSYYRVLSLLASTVHKMYSARNAILNSSVLQSLLGLLSKEIRKWIHDTETNIKNT